jgi:trehalose/maltose hydrolase-like predicted phosphorylase
VDGSQTNKAFNCADKQTKHSTIADKQTKHSTKQMKRSNQVRVCCVQDMYKLQRCDNTDKLNNDPELAVTPTFKLSVNNHEMSALSKVSTYFTGHLY